MTQNVTYHLARVTDSLFIILAYQISKTVIRVFSLLAYSTFSICNEIVFIIRFYYYTPIRNKLTLVEGGTYHII